MKLALSPPVGPVFVLTPEQRAEGLAESRSSPRRRILLPIHREQSDLVQRMVNFLQPGTYIQAHQHPRESATETIIVMSGCLGFITFDESGGILTASRLEPGGLIDIEAGVWHGVLTLQEDTIILEVKRGPFDESDKIFADWAPPENSESAPGYLQWLLSLFRKDEEADHSNSER